MSGLPVVWANGITVVLFITIAIAIWFIPLKRLNHDTPDSARWRDIRIWATLLICIQLVIYAVFR